MFINKSKPKYLEYTSAAVPTMSKLEPQTLSVENSERGHQILTPNLRATYLKFNKSKGLDINLKITTSNIFYILKGSGKSSFSDGNNIKDMYWNEGDIFTMPFINSFLQFESLSDECIIFYSSDQPLIEFLNCKPEKARFSPTIYLKEEMMDEITKFNNEKDAVNRNRNGVLLTNEEMIKEGLNTITHTMWSLMNSIGPNVTQKPHRHNSIAIDLCVDIHEEAEEKEQVYTLMGENLNDKNEIINPVKMLWKKGCTFTTPPGWWHSHHNESNHTAWVFPVQDAGLHTQMRTLDIRFVK
tara:strand:- start:29 stop:922 length:894 start_codon:yes stop_codon:yes gene_type:complete